jgi:hypothetical protein
MKKSFSKIRDEIAKLHEQLKIVEAKEVERIGRIALKVGLAEMDIDDADMQAAFDEIANRFRGGHIGSPSKNRTLAEGNKL